MLLYCTRLFRQALPCAQEATEILKVKQTRGDGSNFVVVYYSNPIPTVNGNPSLTLDGALPASSLDSAVFTTHVELLY